VIQNLDSFKGEASFTTWLHRVTVNASLKFREKRSIREHENLRDQEETGQRWAHTPAQQSIDKETHQLIEKAIANLPEDYRKVLVLSDIEGMKNSEIGEAMNLSLPAVKSRLHRARLLMREALAPHFEEEVT
ncbi:MAG: sigma-70 family RNA polymerase sigma factor, partial [Patescibacteria group bacterium]|nr:sigma-70 family RNA polymerase sigma factor [Patescibacteria group bacterium]